MIQLYDHVVNRRDRDELDPPVKAGTLGVIMSIYNDGEGYTVEFVDFEGRSLGLVTDYASEFDADVDKYALPLTGISYGGSYEATVAPQPRGMVIGPRKGFEFYFGSTSSISPAMEVFV